MNFNNYTRIQLGLPPASADAGMAAVRRARVMQMNGFGAFAGPAISEVTGQPCSAGDYSTNWEGYCNCLFKPGGELMKTCCGPENVKSDGSCGVPAGNAFQFGWTGFLTAPWSLLGKVDRFARRTGLSGQAKKALEDQYNAITSGQTGGTTPGDTVGGNDTDTGSGGIEEKKDNTMLLLGAGLAAVALIAFSMRK